MSATRTAYATCPLCEATCGLEFEIGEGDGVLRIRGDSEDVLSHGFVCPKGASLKPLHEDPDRLRAPLVRRGGRLEEATWDEAFAEVERRLPPLLEESGRDAVAVYIGNPAARAPTRCSCSASSTRSSTRGSTTRAPSASTWTGSKWSASWRASSRPNVSPAHAGSRPRRSAGWRVRWPRRRARPSTGGSAPARRSSGRSPAGWWTS